MATKGVRWRGLLVTAIDGTMMCCPDSAANPRVFRRGGGYHGGTGYPMIRLLAPLACGTRTVIDATFGSDRIGETTYARDLLPALHRGMIVLADRNFGSQGLIAAIADTGAQLLIRVKNGRKLPVCRRLPDGSYVSRMGQTEIRVIRATITIVTSADPDRASFTVALNAARDQLVQAAGVIAGTVIDLIGVIGHHVLNDLMPTRRVRTNPRVVKRAISNYVAKTANGRIRGPSRDASIEIDILPIE